MGISHTTVAGAKELYDPHKDRFDRTNIEQLEIFAHTVRKELRVKTIPRCDNTAYVYRDGDLMTMGYIGFGDFATSVHGDDKYIVCARGIENMKYCESGDQHNMRMALKMNTAMKHAKRSLQSYSIHEYALVLAKGVKSKVEDSVRATKDKCNEAVSAVGLDARSYGTTKKATDRLMAEMRSMIQAGHTFNDKELDADIRTMFALTEDRKLFSDVIPMQFIHVNERYGQQVVNCARLKDITAWRSEVEHVHTLRPDEVPEDIQHGCAALSICEDGQFVDGVGYRVNDHTFYLYV